jgi:hypothetical protein
MAKGELVTIWSRAADTDHAEALTLAYSEGAAVAFGLMGMAEAIRDRVWTCLMCEGDTDGDECEWCQAPRGMRCSQCDAGACEEHVRSCA